MNVARVDLLESAAGGEVEHDDDPLDKSVRTVGCATLPKLTTGFARANG
jgi:hypothetical protein